MGDCGLCSLDNFFLAKTWGCIPTFFFYDEKTWGLRFPAGIIFLILADTLNVSLSPPKTTFSQVTSFKTMKGFDFVGSSTQAATKPGSLRKASWPASGFNKAPTKNFNKRTAISEVMEIGWNWVIWDLSFVCSHLQFPQQSMINRGTNVFFGCVSGCSQAASHSCRISSATDPPLPQMAARMRKLATFPQFPMTTSMPSCKHGLLHMRRCNIEISQWHCYGPSSPWDDTKANAFAWRKCLLLVGKDDFRMAGQFVIFLFRSRLTQRIQAVWKFFWRTRFITSTSPQMSTKMHKQTCSWPESDRMGHESQKTGTFHPWTPFHRFTCHAKQSRSRHAQRGSTIPNRPNCHPWNTEKEE